MNAPKTRIVIVEDNPDDQILLLRQLHKAGLDEHVKVINDGRVGYNYLCDEQTPCHDFVAVFLDLKLPSMSGLEILKALRSNERTNDPSCGNCHDFVQLTCRPRQM